MFFCRKCLIAAAAAPKVLTPILVPAATLTEEEEGEEGEEGENEDSTPKMINASRNTPRTSPTIPPTNPTTKPNKTRMIAITKSILMVWRSLFPNKSCTFTYTMILEHVYSNALPYLIIESVMLQRLLFGRQLLKEVAVGAIRNIKKDGGNGDVDGVLSSSVADDSLLLSSILFTDKVLQIHI
jgi:hypothetical protein